MFIVRHLLEALINPFFLLLLMFGFLLILLWVYGSNFGESLLGLRIGFSVVFLLMVLFSSGWLAELLTRKLEDQYPAITKVDSTIHWVVVLSGGQAELSKMPANDILNGVSIKRLVEGLRLYRQLPQSRLILSGGSYGSGQSEAAHLSELTAWFAIPTQDIVLEDKSINTVEQVKAIKQLVQNQPFYLVTSAIHMPRSICLARAYGLQPIPAPTDYTFYWNDELWPIRYLPNAHNLFYLSIVMHELLGRTWAKIHGDCQASLSA